MALNLNPSRRGRFAAPAPTPPAATRAMTAKTPTTNWRLTMQILITPAEAGKPVPQKVQR